jgi:hypothetical protein
MSYYHCAVIPELRLRLALGTALHAHSFSKEIASTRPFQPDLDSVYR